MRRKLNHGTETETLEFGGPVPFVIVTQGGSVKLSLWRRPGSRRAVFVGTAAARRLADAVDAVDAADADDGEIARETADGGAEVVVRRRGESRELTVPRQLRRGRRVVRLNPFETAVATALREAAAEIDCETAATARGGEA